MAVWECDTNKEVVGEYKSQLSQYHIYEYIMQEALTNMLTSTHESKRLVI